MDGENSPSFAEHGAKTQHQLVFKLPAPPPSMNSMYNVIYGLKRIILKPEVMTYKTIMKGYVPLLKVEKMDKILLHFNVSQNWLFKNGHYKKQDVQNMGKVLCDIVSEKQGWDDSQVWEFSIRKLHNQMNEFVEVQEEILRDA